MLPYIADDVETMQESLSEIAVPEFKGIMKIHEINYAPDGTVTVKDVTSGRSRVIDYACPICDHIWAGKA